MESLKTFINDITAFEFNIPLGLKISFIIILIILCAVAGYVFKDIFDISYLRNGYTWFIFVTIINLISILVIYYYYGTKQNTYIGQAGQRGKRGKRGKKGTSVSCGYNCKNNLYLQTVRKTDTICTLNTYTKEFIPIHNAMKYFMNLITQGNNIDYAGLILNYIHAANASASTNTAITNFNTLINPKALAILLVKYINDDITTAAEYSYGTINNAIPKVGYISIGNAVYGGVENFKLNSFVVNGDIMYPSGYNKLVSFQSYNENTNDYDKYTIWEPMQQKVTDNIYLALGDVCSYGDDHPNLNDYALINENCLELVSYKDLKLVFIYVGNLDIIQTENQEFTQSNNYLIENKLSNDIQFFSVWRTPMNTFVTNCNSNNVLVNDTVMYNLANNLKDTLNSDSGAVTNEYKKWIQSRLENVTLPQFIIALIYTMHFQYESNKELIYYINKYQTQIPELRGYTPTSTTTLSELLGMINDIKRKYDNYNEQLYKRASGGIEKHLPKKLLDIYDNITTELDVLPVKIENALSMLDVINHIIPNGLNGRIAVDSDGIAEGGIMLNPIQEIIIRMCKIIFPPNKATYIIKDECLGTFARDNDKEEKIKQLTAEKDKYNKMINIITNDYNKYQYQILNIKSYEEIAERKMGMLCGNIKNYMEKIHNLDMEEFTITRISGLIAIYKETNQYLEDIVKNTP